MTARRCERAKYYVDGGQVEIAAHLVYELDPDGKQLGSSSSPTTPPRRCAPSTPMPPTFAKRWADADGRSEIIAALEERGIDFDELAEAAEQPDADPFDLLCHLAFNAPLRTRRERAERLRTRTQGLLRPVRPRGPSHPGRTLEKYADHGTAQFTIPDVLKVPPISEHGNVHRDRRLVRRRRTTAGGGGRIADSALCRA